MSDEEADEFLREVLKEEGVLPFSKSTWKEVVDYYMLDFIKWIEADPWEFIISVSMIMLPLFLISAWASYTLMSKEMKEQGLEMPSLSNSWSFTSKAKQPKGKSAARARLAKKSDKSKSDKPKSDKPKKKSGKETSSD